MYNFISFYFWMEEHMELVSRDILLDFREKTRMCMVLILVKMVWQL